MLILSVILFMAILGAALFFTFIAGFFKDDAKPAKKLFPLGFSVDAPFYILFSGLFLPFLLIASAWSLYYSLRWTLLLSFLSLVALIYSSLKSYIWGGANPGNRFSVVIQIAGFIGGGVSIIILILHFQ